MAKNDGGPAFPVSFIPGTDYGEHSSPGMSLRDWFAGRVMQALISTIPNDESPTMTSIAEKAYGMADAMIEERDKVKETNHEHNQ